METTPIEMFSRNGPSGRWTICPGSMVAVTFAGLYFAGRGIVVRITCRDPILVRIRLLESSPAIQGLKLPFPERGFEFLSECVGEELTWEAQYLRPYGTIESLDNGDVGGPPKPVLLDEKPIGRFLTLKEGMEVTLLVSDKAGSRCAALGVIQECSPRGEWSGFLVPHSFFVIVKLTKVNTEFGGHTACSEDPSITTMGGALNHRVLWSGYNVRPTEPVCPSEDPSIKDEYIRGPPNGISPLRRKVDLPGDGFGISDAGESVEDHEDGTREDIDGKGSENANGSIAHPDRPLWRGKLCDLLNDDLSFYGKAKIVVCLPDEPFDEDILGDTNVGILFLSDGDQQMTSFRWPLTHVRLEGGRLLSEIVAWCSEHASSSGEESGLEGIPKNPYRHMKRRKLIRSFDSKLKSKTSDADVQKVSSMKCCKFQCCQTFSWDDTLALRRKFYASTFEGRRELAYSVQGQLHSLPERRKMFITLSNREVCENAWYIIHGVSRSSYHAYKAAALAGRVNGMHGNAGIARPRAHTIQAEANFMTIIQENADRMPNEFRNIGRKRVHNLLVLPSALNWDHMMDISNSQSARCNVKPVSQSTVSVIKKKLFRHVEVKAPNDNFSRCTECDFLQDCISRYPRGSEEWATLVKDRTRHINYQNACRRLYHGWSSNSVDSPTEFLCIIHDKMDHTKSAIPRMQRTTKATAGLGQIPISVTGMLTHGHGDGAYAHYSTAFWPGDSNFTISSICRVLRALERPPVKDSKDLLTVPPQNSFFEALLHGKSRCSASVPEASSNKVQLSLPGRPVVPLPKKLFLQLDNSAKDNKNRYVMAFCSLLTARKIFKEVTVGFLIVGHTHEDIDAHFSYLSKLLKMKNTYVLADLMKAFMDSQKTTAFIPELVQEVADFKKFLQGYQHDGANKLIGLGEMHLFKFYVEEEGDDMGWPVMRYKKRATDQSWLPPGPAIRMWRENDDGTPKLPEGVPTPVPLRPLWGNVAVDPTKKNQEKEIIRAGDCLTKQSFIQQGIAKYIALWKSMMERDAMYAKDMACYVRYWERIYSEITGPVPLTPTVLQEGFWPVTNWQRDHARSTSSGGWPDVPPDTTPEDDPEPFPYCGPAKARPKPSFNPYRDVLLGDFVLCRPCDGQRLPVWLGRAVSTVDMTPGGNYGTFVVEWWTPMCSKKEPKSLVARECWTRRWTPEVTHPQRISVTTVLYSHRMPSHKDKGPPKTHLIPEASAVMALANLAASGAIASVEVGSDYEEC